ncbi:STAS domain-containing protein [Saccharothrix sp. S26]|uniref:STAS domain-containing protein n=1 Tax=Saccharothrix sp. S26 TaxID=2907215 RepID=UPI001F17EB74|nr:STAS domain-containing protein [Saccharothrix sp. S26]MCE6994956.1 STAS domain-containing protein [Saccharothrix sp. S26]
MGETCTDSTDTTTRIHHHGGVAVVEVTGEVDTAWDASIRAAVADQLDRRPAGLVLDLTKVDFFGSTGIQLLVEAALRARELGVALTVATDRRLVLRPLEITMVIGMLDIRPTLRDALAALRSDDLSTSHR